MKSDWLNFNFNNLRKNVKESHLTEQKKFQYNKVLLEIYADIKEYEALKMEDIAKKQLLLETMNVLNKTLQKANEYEFQIFFKNSI